VELYGGQMCSTKASSFKPVLFMFFSEHFEIETTKNKNPLNSYIRELKRQNN
jgi:hypothetical protein